MLNLDQTETTVLFTVIANMVVVGVTMLASISNTEKTIEQLKTRAEAEASERFRQLKRRAYTELLSSLEDLSETQKPKTKEERDRYHSAGTRMNLALAALDVIAPISISMQAATIEDYADIPRGKEERETYLNILANLMREDLEIDGRFEDLYIRGSEREGGK